MRPFFQAVLSLAGSAALGACGGIERGASIPAHPSGAVRQAVLRVQVPPAPLKVLVIGHSVKGRAILARVVGSPAASRRIVVVGCVHGNETAGEAVTRLLRSATPKLGTQLWLVDTFNPDGCAANTRQNAHGVDLNRNSPWHWEPIEAPGGTFYSGTGPLSEPESRAINRLIKTVRPNVSVWYHQHAALVDDASGGNRTLEARYARAVGLPLRNYGTFPGSITSWQNATYPRDTAFVVELPAGPLPRPAVARHAAAILALG
jgi:murein peptide amidase A